MVYNMLLPTSTDEHCSIMNILTRTEFRYFVFFMNTSLQRRHFLGIAGARAWAYAEAGDRAWACAKAGAWAEINDERDWIIS